MIGGWHRYVRERGDALIVHQAAEIEQAKREGKAGLILHCLGTTIVEDEIDLLDSYHEAGFRVVQLCYNTKNLVGDGASEQTDSGLSYFGLRLVESCNALGLLADCSHSGYRTSMDAVEVSSAPVVIAHTNGRAVQNNGRNVEDDLIKAGTLATSLANTLPLAVGAGQGFVKYSDNEKELKLIREGSLNGYLAERKAYPRYRASQIKNGSTSATPVIEFAENTEEEKKDA